MIRKFVKAALALTAVVPAALTVTASPAAASGNGYLWACWIAPGSIINGGCGKFYQHGEIVVARDNIADGWAVRAQIQKLLPDSNGVLHWVNHSKSCFDDTSTSNTTNGGTSCNYEVAEGVTVRLHVWASRNGTTRYHEYSPSIKA